MESEDAWVPDPASEPPLQPRPAHRPFGFMLVLVLCGFFGFLGWILYWTNGAFLRFNSVLLGYLAPFVWLAAVLVPIAIALPVTRRRYAWLTRHNADLWVIGVLAVVSAYLWFKGITLVNDAARALRHPSA